MKNKKTNKIIILSVILVIFLIFLIIFILNYSKDSYSFSLIEKKWIKDNATNVIDVSVYNDVAVFGENGRGVIFDYLDNFTKKYEIKFNKISYFTDDKGEVKNVAFRVLNTGDSLSKNDILLYEDKYVLASRKNASYDKITDLENITIGVLASDVSLVSYTLSEAKNITYKTYDDIDKITSDYSNKVIDYVILPENRYLDFILKNDLKMVLHLNDLSQKYVLTVNNNATLLNILNKYSLQFLDKDYNDSYKKNFIDFFFRVNNIGESEKMSYNASSYNYGYVTNIPLESPNNNLFGGILSNYLSGFEDLFDVDFKVVKYNSIYELKQALSRGELDLAFGNYSDNNLNIDTIHTKSLFKEQYVVLSRSDKVLDSIKSLKDKEVMMVNSTMLFDYVNSIGIKVRAYNNTDEVLRHVTRESILVIDKYTYDFYKNRKLESFNVVYEGVLPTDYTFLIRDVNKNSTFASLFKYYVEHVDYKDFTYKYNIVSTVGTGIPVMTILIVLCSAIVLVLVVVFISRHLKKNTALKKEDKLKFIDAMTSLKNRNYLNYNIKAWDDNVIYPQSFVVIDLNNIKYINDSHGYEEGDNVIKKAASILIVNQLPNTDIMRTDGNEFLVYMVGYDEKQVVSYTRKIYKELKELPYGFGATLGYSMITDDIKTVDDAINEATIEMRNAKEK